MLRIAEFTLLASRLLLAAVFLLAGAAKLIDPLGSRRALREFGLPSILARPLVLLLPCLELAVALALVPARLAWYGAQGALALLTVFLIAVAVAMVRGRKPDCHCFGQLHSAPVGRSVLIRNMVLAACAGWLVSRGPRESGPDLLVWFATLDVLERKVAIVAACAVGFLFLRLLYSARPKTESLESQLFPDSDDDESPEERPARTPRRRTAAVQPESPDPAPSGAMGIGLPIGTPAPEFELPAITGEKASLQSLRSEGKDILLIFTSPFCDPCRALAPNLVRWTREMNGLPNVVLLSRGTAQDNLAKLKEVGTSRVLLQPDFAVAEAYDVNSTPSAVLVGADGLIRSELAVGGMAIKQLLSSAAKRVNPQPERTKQLSIT
ncbi:MAG TPA: MauE/DoxX family redox-associated membrane protein [Bryobacteraceae bacterium]|nr:MauE/DoxX family redox-associated membrane protein [Bryobacteraceae bacterium]